MFLLIATLLKFIFFGLVFAIGLAAVLTWMERRQSAYSQDRLGPTRAHFFKIGGKPFTLFGLLHIAADGASMFFKEPVTPKNADKLLFKIAPLIGWTTALVTLALIPFGPSLPSSVFPASWIPEGVETIYLQMAHVDSGILIVLAIGSLGVYGAAIGGWASNNRFALLGGLRATAQSVSYEVALGLTLVGILMAYGSTELGSIVESQNGLLFGFLPAWGLFIQPLGAVLFFIAATAETKRTPFDMPEGESEIIGYFLEYSSMQFGLFMLGEFLEIVVLGALFTTLFLGGWQFPHLIGTDSVSVFGLFTWNGPVAVAVSGTLVFCVKTFFVCSLQLQLRWTLPRFRYDQVMRLGWKTLLPLALINIFVTAGLIWWDPTLSILSYVSIGIILLFVLVVIAGPRRPPQVAHGH
ncbi:MAG: hypothetical protein A2341_05560 [Deltaproteobacteria bacterium RIFOXYB12_FULL_58_9]|nr:MAG: hypothetical protein A2341_05560 [Deltaproteobacteria bacterium RIFOXYB12_FULL_58_9]